MPLIEFDTFDGDLGRWFFTSGITITNGKLNLPSGGNTNQNVALYHSSGSARAIEVVVHSGSFAHTRFAFGTNLNNWAFYSPYSGKLFSKRNNQLREVPSNLIVTADMPVSGDKLRAVLQGQNVQYFVNGLLRGTLSPTTRVIPDDGTIYAGVAWHSPNENLLYDSAAIYLTLRPRYMHLSVDDVLSALKALAIGGYSSVWDHPTFAFYKQMHETFGAKFSLYCFFTDGDWNLSYMPTNFKNEFQSATHWLRFGFHAYDEQTRYNAAGMTAKTAANHYNAVVNAICAFAGGKAVDTVPRIHYYEGTLEIVRTWRDNTCGIHGLLTADDTRTSVYYLDSIHRDALIKCDDLYQPTEDLYFVHTDLRLENTPDVINTLNVRLKNFTDFAGQQDIYSIFTHEIHIATAAMKIKIQDCCAWAVRNGFKFAFPMDNIQKF